MKQQKALQYKLTDGNAAFNCYKKLSQSHLQYFHHPTSDHFGS